MKLYTLGTSHGSTEKGKACSGHLLEINDKYYLFDCGANVEEKMTDMDMTIEKIQAVFITHMHIDHTGTFLSMIKRFYNYNALKSNLLAYFPDQNGIDGFKYMTEMYRIKTTIERVRYHLINPGEIYSDENITVNAIPTKHLEYGKYPSYAFDIKAEGKRFIYTGDLCKTFEDYPEIISKENFDAVLCEYAHFDIEKNLEQLSESRTKKMIFTHFSDKNIPLIEKTKQFLPFEVCIAKDGMCFEI